MATDGLSIAATRLLTSLRARAAPQTDAALAVATGLPERDVIDVADELLIAGYLVCATSASPSGRWLGTIEHARQYDRVLRMRALKILVRRRHLRQAIARARGQLALAFPAPGARR